MRYGESNGLVYRAILEQISSGRLAPGERLREGDIAEKLGTSRTPVREALRALAAEGLVEIVQNRGATVRDWSQEQIYETYGLRAVLEGYGARLAAAGRDEERVARLTDIQDRTDALLAERPDGFHETLASLNSEFHRTVVEMANSPILTNIVDNLASLAMVTRIFRGYHEADLQRSLIQHRDVIRGIVQQDGDLAAAAMSSHILAARPVALAAFDGKQQA